MATPRDITIDNLNGNWTLNKALSSEVDPILKLQEINWLFRKAIAVTDICLRICTSHTLNSQTGEDVVKIDFLQTPSVGRLASTTETRTLNWKAQQHFDYFFGEAECRSSFVRASSGSKNDGRLRPDFELQVGPLNMDIKRFLRGEISPYADKTNSISEGFLVEEPGDGQGRGLWVHTHERSVRSDWEVEQIWGFEMIDEKRYFTRRLVVTGSKGRHICGRLVYDFKGYHT
ncbi:uncharacterized protein N7515_006835 [Penicillium bovifimosum]|uniref:Uncharacterized protein n=1 Tax=Penicillium bovifimosum TaxID=126998 RepID=A0A9W9GWS3_9EURO|nr:uncharacterized protein N7515_006835 [Penicillium bovifimosum]KAJ5130796.1 hypothetical protein N7515_006835 [Penicillium bovifimosum]